MKAHPWFNPLWRRVLVFAVCFAWFLGELWGGDRFWQGMTFLLTAYAAWDFFLRSAYPTETEPDR